MISVSSEVFLPLTQNMKALKPVSSCNLRLGNPPEFQPPLSPFFSGDEWFFPWLGWIFCCCGREKEERTVDTMEMLQQQGLCSLYLLAGKRCTIWRLYTLKICDRPEKHLMNVHRRSRHRPLPLASSSYHVPFRHCVLPWKIENRTAVTAERCSWKCRAAIMSNL